MVRRLLVAAACTFLAISVMAAEQLGLQVSLIRHSADTGALRLTWTLPVQLRIDSSAEEYLLTFSRPLGNPDFASAAADLAPFLRDVRFGYDSVLLVITPGTRAEFEREPSGVIARFSRAAPAPTQSGEPVTADGDWRLEYLHAIASLESGDIEAAEVQLRQLARAHPHEPEILLALARVTEQRGDWSHAFALYDAAAGPASTHRAAAAARDRLWSIHGDQLSAEFGRRDTDHADDQGIMRINGRMVLTPRLSALARIERRTLEAPQVQRVNGSLSAADLTRHRAELGVEYRHGLRRGQLGALFGPDSLGLRARVDASSARQDGWIEVSINDPYWDYVEGLVEGATRHRLGAGVDWKLAPLWQAALSASISRYAMEEVGDVADSVGIGGSLGYLLHRNVATWRAVYRLDAEFFSDVTQRRVAGGEFAPLPAADREVHALGIEVGRRDAAQISYHAGLGYSVDRKGADAPYIALQVDYWATPKFLLGARGSYSLAVDRREDDPVTYLGLVTEYRFDRPTFPRAWHHRSAIPRASTTLLPPR